MSKDKKKNKDFIDCVNNILTNIHDDLTNEEAEWKSYCGFQSVYSSLKRYNHPDPILVAPGIAVSMSTSIKKMKHEIQAMQKSFNKNPSKKSALEIADILWDFHEKLLDKNFVFTIDDMLNSDRNYMTIIEEIVFEDIRNYFSYSMRSELRHNSEVIRECINGPSIAVCNTGY